jgi:hypothetical protein
MKTSLILLLLFSAALLPACNREKSKETAPPPEPAVPAVTAPAPEAPVGTVSPPATVASPPAPVSKPPAAAKAVRKNRSRPPVFSQPGAPPPTATIERAPSEISTPAPPPKPEWREVTLSAGTVLPLVLTTAVSSETAIVETAVSARLRQPVSTADTVALPEGTVFTGTVTDVERSGRVQGRAHLAVVFDQAQLEETTLPIRTHEVRFEAEATTTEDAAKIGGGAIGGAILGGILGGAKGAAKGAVIGGAAGTGVVIMTRGKEVNLTSGTEIAATLATPLTVTVPLR